LCNMITMIKSKRMKSVGHVARRNKYTNLVGKFNGRDHLAKLDIDGSSCQNASQKNNVLVSMFPIFN
jgi:hypothetical protein